MITVDQENRNLYSSWWKRHRNFADYFCCSHKFSTKLLLNMFKINIYQTQTYSKTGIIIWVRCTFSHHSAEVQFVMFYWLHKASVGGRSYSSTTDNYWVFTQTKVISIYGHKPIVTYWTLMKRQALFTIFYYSVAKTLTKSSQACGLRRKTLKGWNAAISKNIQLVFCCVMKKLLIFYMCEI